MSTFLVTFEIQGLQSSGVCTISITDSVSTFILAPPVGNGISIVPEGSNPTAQFAEIVFTPALITITANPTAATSFKLYTWISTTATEAQGQLSVPGGDVIVWTQAGGGGTISGSGSWSAEAS